MAISEAFAIATDAEFKEMSNFSTPPRAGRVLAIEANGQVRVESDDPDGGDVLAWPLNGFIYAVGDVVYIAFAVNSPDSAIVVGSRAPLPGLDPGVFGGGFVELDGSTPLTGDWDTGEDRSINIERIEARDAEGLRLEDDGGNLGILVADGGDVGVGSATDPSGLEVNRAVSSVLRGRTNVRMGVEASTPRIWFESLAAALEWGVDVNNLNGNFRFFVGGLVAMQLTSSGQLIAGNLASAGATWLAVRAGTSANDAAVGGVLYEEHVNSGNVGAGEDDLASYSVPANTLAVDGQSLWFEAWGALVLNANAKTLRVRFGTGGVNDVLTRPMVVSSAGPWHLRGRIVRTGASAERSICSILDGTAQQVFQSITLNQANNTPTVLKVTGEGVANNDLTLLGFVVGWDDGNV